MRQKLSTGMDRNKGGGRIKVSGRYAKDGRRRRGGLVVWVALLDRALRIIVKHRYSTLITLP
jgi:hypothetical protein